MIKFIFLYFFPILFTFIGFLVIFYYFNTQKKNKLCTCSTTGKVIRIINKSVNGKCTGQKFTRYYRIPCFKYFVNGRAYTILGFSAKLYPLGSVATIYYNPSSPDMAHTGEKGPALKIGIFFILSAVFYIVFWIIALRVVIYLP